jgi:hypothetical protein
MIETKNPTVEGSLDIYWMNCTSQTAAPQYNLFFLRYANFKGGVQQPNAIIGDAVLEVYLVKLGFAVQNARNWIEQIRKTGHTVSIPNVMMPQQHLADFGL